jgi:hypothetical protein
MNSSHQIVNQKHKSNIKSKLYFTREMIQKPPESIKVFNNKQYILEGKYTDLYFEIIVVYES